MMSLPPIDIPTAIVAVLMSFVANFVKEEIQRIRRAKKSKKQEIIDYLTETKKLAREIQIASASHEIKFDMALSNKDIMNEVQSIDDLLKEAELDEDVSKALEVMREDPNFQEENLLQYVRRQLENEQISVQNKAISEFESYYTELKSLWASMTFDQDQEKLVEVRDQIMKVTATCLAYSMRESIPKEDYDALFEEAGDLAETAQGVQDTL